MNVACRLAAWMTMVTTLLVPVSEATDSHEREMPRLSSFYLDDGSCSAHPGETTETFMWQGRLWNLTAPEALASPPSETNRNGTPLHIRPLNDFVTQARSLGAVVANRDQTISAESQIGLRLVMVVHNLVADGPAQFSLQTTIAVRLCGSSERPSGSALYIGPPEGVSLTEWWRSRRSQRWIDGYREAFSLSVADALHWAAGEAQRN